MKGVKRWEFWGFNSWNALLLYLFRCKIFPVPPYSNQSCLCIEIHCVEHVSVSMCVWTSARWNFVYQTGIVPQRENVHKHKHCHSLSPSNSHSLFLAMCQWKWTREETGKHHPWFSFLASKPWQQNRDKSLRNGRNTKLLSWASEVKLQSGDLKWWLKMKSLYFLLSFSPIYLSYKAKKCELKTSLSCTSCEKMHWAKLRREQERSQSSFLLVSFLKHLWL